MGFIVGIDTGGTFTDGYFVKDGEVKRVKVLTTPHDFSECLSNCLKEGASLFSLTLNDMLRNTDAVRYSTTIATNTVITKTGAKVGLIVTKGYEDSLYRQDLDQPSPIDIFVKRSLIIGVDEAADEHGKITKKLDEGEARAAVEKLVDTGARIAVAFKNSHINPAHELKIREIVREEYPKQYLGAVPVLLSHEVGAVADDAIRTNTVVLNTYLHKGLAHYLYKAEEDLRRAGYRWPLQIVNSHGGLSRISKTRALQTHGSGPSAGVFGGLTISQLYGYRDLVLTDMGGTSFDLGLIEDGKFMLDEEAAIEGVPVYLSALRILSIGVGGGSIAHVSDSGELEVGPGSAGSMPGPACYDLGGTEPTVTDADVLLGYIDPDYFLGGRMKLNAKMAEDAVKFNVADLMGIDVLEAAKKIREKGDGTMGLELKKLLGDRQDRFTLLAYGGAGPTHCCSFSRHIGVKRIMAFPFSPVFCAFGASTMNILHTYEESSRLDLSEDFAEDFTAVVVKLKERALRDIRGEGYSERDMVLSLELSLASKGKKTRVEVPVLETSSAEDAEKLRKAALKALPPNEDVDVKVEGFSLKAMIPMGKPEIPRFKAEGEDSSRALKSKRDVYWDDGFYSTPIYERNLLKPGNSVRGPAVVEAEDTTLVLPEGYRLTVDQYLSCMIERD